MSITLCVWTFSFIIETQGLRIPLIGLLDNCHLIEWKPLFYVCVRVYGRFTISYCC